jgi:hypothetical protein
MNSEDIATLQNSRDALAAEINQIEERYKAEIGEKRDILKAYDLVLRHAQSNGQAPSNEESNVRGLTRQIVAVSGYGYNTKVVRQAIQHFNQPFTIRDIFHKLAENGINLDISAVTTVVNRLREGDYPDVRIKQQGVGRRPTYYVRT